MKNRNEDNGVFTIMQHFDKVFCKTGINTCTLTKSLQIFN